MQERKTLASTVGNTQSGLEKESFNIPRTAACTELYTESLGEAMGLSPTAKSNYLQYHTTARAVHLENMVLKL